MRSTGCNSPCNFLCLFQISHYGSCVKSGTKTENFNQLALTTYWLPHGLDPYCHQRSSKGQVGRDPERRQFVYETGEGISLANLWTFPYCNHPCWILQRQRPAHPAGENWLLHSLQMWPFQTFRPLNASNSWIHTLCMFQLYIVMYICNSMNISWSV